MKSKNERGRPADVRKFVMVCCRCCQDKEGDVRKHACMHLPKEKNEGCLGNE